MNMDRSQKNLEKKKDDRTIEYLELKYDTNIQRGLTLAKVRQKQRGKRSSRNSITKEKKRIWKVSGRNVRMSGSISYPAW